MDPWKGMVLAMTAAYDDNSILEVKLGLDSLCIYRNLLSDPVIRRFYSLLEHVSGSFSDSSLKITDFLSLYTEFYRRLVAYGNSTDFFSYIIEKLVYDENPFTAQPGIAVQPAFPLPEAVIKHDLEALQKAAALPPAEIKAAYAKNTKAEGLYAEAIDRLPCWNESRTKTGECSAACLEAGNAAACALAAAADWSKCLEDLKKFHRIFGCGDFARFSAFVWRRSDGAGRLVPVETPDPVRLSDLVDYEMERSEVVKNTEQFLDGYPANNVLLYGDRGTGKSSTVKAILNEYSSRGLRVIEVPKNLLVDFPEIVSGLSGKNHKFILFVDDLAFEDNEENYTALKAVLEGSLSVKPRNVLIYATSNRRHLIKEKFSDRAGLQYGDRDDEVRAYDTMQEKLSLSDRFGITVVFSAPDKARYLHIIEELAERNGIIVDRDELHREALKWELWYNGRSPRTAQQFVTWLKGAKAK